MKTILGRNNFDLSSLFRYVRIGASKLLQRSLKFFLSPLVGLLYDKN
jgi:hypothetical protein